MEERRPTDPPHYSTWQEFQRLCLWLRDPLGAYLLSCSSLQNLNRVVTSVEVYLGESKTPRWGKTPQQKQQQSTCFGRHFELKMMLPPGEYAKLTLEAPDSKVSTLRGISIFCWFLLKCVPWYFACPKPENNGKQRVAGC